MREKTRSTIWAITCALLLLFGEAAAFFFAWRVGTWVAIAELIAFVLGGVVAPVLHELGHIVMAKSKNMQIVYAKFSFLKWTERNGKPRLAFASPFAMDETQAIPKSGGNMKKRAKAYTLGGLLFGGFYLLVVLLVALVFTFTIGSYAAFGVWGLLPFAGYLFLLNVLPLEYGSGKTDMLVYIGLKNGSPAEKTMLSAMEIQGELYDGKTYREIDEKWYFDLPQLAEDEPLFIVILDLRYRYYLDKGDYQKAGDCLNRLVQTQEYFTEIETEKIAAELVYMHAINGDRERAETCGKGCVEYLQQDTLTAKRILTAVAYLDNKKEAVKSLKAQATALLQTEKIVGNRRFEESLLSRIPDA